jgi:hypothetical protein
MALAPFFDRIYTAVGRHLSVSRDSLERTLSGLTVDVLCGGKCDEEGNEQWASELVINLLARLYPRIAIEGPKDTVERLQALAKRINSKIDFDGVAAEHASIAVDHEGRSRSIHASSSGWVARTSRERLPGGSQNPYAAGAAGALAVGSLFRRLLLGKPEEPDFSISLLDFSRDAGAGEGFSGGNIGQIAFVGVGAVGNGAIWALARHQGVMGHLRLIDQESLTDLNLQRYVLGAAKDVGTQKVTIAATALARSSLQVTKEPKSFDQFVDASNGTLDIPTICVSVDNVEARRSAQAMLPRLTINGWTGETAFGASWHVFSRDAACLACLYQPRGAGPSQTEQAAEALGLTPERAALLWVTRQPLSDDDIASAATRLGVEPKALRDWRRRTLGELYTDVVCGAAPIELPGIKRIEAVPLAHQSALAGILMAAELIKRTLPDVASRAQQDTLIYVGDVLRAPPPIWTIPRAREKGCICGDSVYQDAYREKWGASA